MIVKLTADDVQRHVSDFIELLQDSVNGGASVGFIAPLDAQDAADYWSHVIDNMRANELDLLAAIEGNKVIGSVQLAPVPKANGRHRADVQKLLVHSQWRRQKIGEQLMHAIEAHALTLGRWLLILDTERGSGAQYLYEKLGYIQSGIIPQYVTGNAGEYLDTVVFYKMLKG